MVNQWWMQGFLKGVLLQYRVHEKFKAMPIFD